MKNKHKNAVKRRLMIFGSLSVAVIIYSFVNLTFYIISSIDLRNKEKELNQELLKLKEQEENLTIELTKLKDPEYIARYARENYLYSRDGEYLIRIEKKETSQVKEEQEKKTYIPVIIVCLSLIALVKIIKRKKK